jgi:hypothetical protein
VSKDGRGLCWVHIYSRLRLFLGANRYTLFAGKPSCMMNRSVVAPKVADDTCVRRCRWVRVGLLRARSGFLWCAHGAQYWPGSCLKCPQVVFVASNGKMHLLHLSLPCTGGLGVCLRVKCVWERSRAKVPGCANGYSVVLPGRRTPRPRNAFEVLDAEMSFLLTAI